MRDQLTEEDWEDITSALRVAGSGLEMAARHFTPDPAIPEKAEKQAVVALRRQADRYRKLASRVALPRQGVE